MEFVYLTIGCSPTYSCNKEKPLIVVLLINLNRPLLQFQLLLSPDEDG